VSILAVSSWAEETTVARQAVTPERATAAERGSVTPSQTRSRRRRGRTLHEFQEKDGSTTFTNIPRKYKGNPDFVEIKIKYERINVPEQYQRYEKPSQYTSNDLASLVSRYARLSGLSPALIYAVIRCESNFEPDAVSKAGARGLMQLMPGTAAEMGVTRIFDPAQNIAGGTQYLMKMMELFKGDKRLALAGYNAGPEAVKKHGGIPPYPETRRYVKDVLAFEKQYAREGPKLGRMKLAQLRGTRAGRASAPADKSRYLVHFHSGLTQPADNLVDKDPYYYIQYGRRTYPVRKDLVKQIEEPA